MSNSNLESEFASKFEFDIFGRIQNSPELTAVSRTKPKKIIYLDCLLQMPTEPLAKKLLKELFSKEMTFTFFLLSSSIRVLVATGIWATILLLQ